MKISLEAGCGTHPFCSQLASREMQTLDGGGYHSGMSVMPLPLDIDDYLWRHKTARKRAGRAARMGYHVSRIEPAYFHQAYVDINRSKAERQGRPMADHYVNKTRTTGLLGEPRCPRHHIVEYGVFLDETLVGYSTIYRCGELVHVSMFIGHGDHLDNGIMYLLILEIIRRQALNGPGFLFYNYHDSGTAGLRWFKEKVGLKAEDVGWMLTT